MSAHSNSVGRATGEGGASATAPTAVLVAQASDGESTYAMFDVRELAPGGGFLAGALLLEPGEELVLELTLAGEATMRIRGRVVRLEHGDDPGMEVAFSDIGERDRKRIEELAPVAEPSRRQYGRDH